MQSTYSQAEQAAVFAEVLPLVRERQLDRMAADRAVLIERLAAHDAAWAQEESKLVATVMSARARVAELRPLYEQAARALQAAENGESIAHHLAELRRCRIKSELAATLPPEWHRLRGDLAFDLRLADARVQAKVDRSDPYKPERVEFVGRQEVIAGQGVLQELLREMSELEQLPAFDPRAIVEDIEARRQAALRGMPALPSGGYSAARRCA